MSISSGSYACCGLGMPDIIPSVSLENYNFVREDITNGRKVIQGPANIYAGFVEFQDGLIYRVDRKKSNYSASLCKSEIYYLGDEKGKSTISCLYRGEAFIPKADIRIPIKSKTVNMNRNIYIGVGELLDQQWKATTNDLESEILSNKCQNKHWLKSLVMHKADITHSTNKELWEMLASSDCRDTLKWFLDEQSGVGEKTIAYWAVCSGWYCDSEHPYSVIENNRKDDLVSWVIENTKSFDWGKGHKVEFYYRGEMIKRNLLWYSIANNRPKTLHALVQKGIDLERFGALHAAADQMQLEMLSLIIGYGVNPNSKTSGGDTALSIVLNKAYTDASHYSGDWLRRYNRDREKIIEVLTEYTNH